MTFDFSLCMLLAGIFFGALACLAYEHDCMEERWR